MHEAGVGGKNFTSGIAELFDEAGLGLEFARPLHGLWLSPGMDTKL